VVRERSGHWEAARLKEAHHAPSHQKPSLSHLREYHLRSLANIKICIPRSLSGGRRRCVDSDVQLYGNFDATATDQILAFRSLTCVLNSALPFRHRCRSGERSGGASHCSDLRMAPPRPLSPLDKKLYTRVSDKANGPTGCNCSQLHLHKI
jgi:hypothetical protein